MIPDDKKETQQLEEKKLKAYEGDFDNFVFEELPEPLIASNMPMQED